jgi:hypothetical protein
MEEQGRPVSNGLPPHYGTMMLGETQHNLTLTRPPPRITPPKKSYSIDSILGDIVHKKSRTDLQRETTANSVVTPSGPHNDYISSGMYLLHLLCL